MNHSTYEMNPEKDKQLHTLPQRVDSFRQEEAVPPPSTRRGLNSRHAIFIAWGGTVGTGLFITTGKSLAMGGPAFLVGSYTITAILVYTILAGIIEIATFLPVRGGSMSHYGSRFVSRSMGFAMSLLYIYSFAILVPFELVASALIIDYWHPGIHSAVWITILLVPLVLLNILPVRFYGEAEFIFTGIKLLTMIGLLMLSFILFWGGGPDRQRLGFHYWKDPGATKTLILDGDIGRFIAAVATMISCALPFTFTPEMVVGTAGEIQSPRKNIPRVARHFTWRLVVFFVGSVIGISIICPSDAAALTEGASNAASSPWVVGIKNAGIHGLDSVINAVALVAAWSTGNAFLYLASRSLHTMAVEGSAPSIFKQCTARGVPIYAVLAISSISLLAYMSASSSAITVLYWLLNLVNTGGFLSWVCCSITYIRFRKACNVQGVLTSQLTQRSWIQPYASWFTLFAFSLLTLLNGFTVFFPSKWAVPDFVSSYIGLPLFLCAYLGHRFVHKQDPWVISPDRVDLQVDQEELNEDNNPDEENNGRSASRWGRLKGAFRRH